MYSPSFRAVRVMERCELLSKISSEENRITRFFLSAEMRKAADLMLSFIQDAGLLSDSDKIDNCFGELKGESEKYFFCGSHYDTVRNAGKYDGVLGILISLEALAKMHKKKYQNFLNFKLVACAEEEGSRFGTPYLGSSYLLNELSEETLRIEDRNGISLKRALSLRAAEASNPSPIFKGKETLGYFEAHIEQGRCLQEKNLALGVVSAIAGQSRAMVTLKGIADHAGNTPMNMRRDALCATAQAVIFIEKIAREREDVVATVGRLKIRPNASNTVPRLAEFSIDLRSPNDKVRKNIFAKIKNEIRRIAEQRALDFEWLGQIDKEAMQTDKCLAKSLSEVLSESQDKTPAMVSGAGHDAAIYGKHVPIIMMFIRCRDGLSHCPQEDVNIRDVEQAIKVTYNFFKKIDQEARKKADG